MENNASRITELIAMLEKVFTEQTQKVMQDHHRALPFADLIVDRWKKAKDLGFGADSSIYDSSLVIGSVIVGKSTWVGPHTVLDGSGKLQIGDFCSISAGVQIYTHDSVRFALSGGKDPIEFAPVSIGNNCYIGPNSVISKGVKLGSGCVIGANSFVNIDIPSGMKAWGAPARLIGLANP